MALDQNRLIEISKDPEIITDEEFEQLKAQITEAYDYLLGLQVVYVQLTGQRYVGILGG